MTISQFNEIAIFGHDDRIRCFGSRENVPILGVPQTKISYGNRGHPVGLRDPQGYRGRQLRVHPDRHATNTGWSSFRAA